MEYTWKEEASAPEINSFNASVASPQIKGTTVKFTVDAEGEGTLQYRFYRMIDGKTTVFRDYSTKNYANANPGTPGSYTIYVDVKDENGNVVTEKMEYTWEKEPTELKINSINVSIASPQTKGTTVKLTVDAEGGEGTLQYRFFRTMNGTTTVFRSFSTSNTANCNPPQAGTYTILVDVMDETGNTVTKSITYQWK